ncbi:solute carrier family 25 (mitochondrial carnitine/acylcarnitine transporter), member 20/29 [Candida albicans P87]|uniref:Mitochondrial thiamine pyrophosphate carrier 1 n=1 Tax=Candida albicans TaxID=5476 RepID=O94071_CANAX|nr:solute carrier family 25 (mitochondrial carnitine/acylcarnitine transporter), member 20/29 [Candida albicans GC75]KGU02030.1 solute carrier family 25 (mitochondrial carnitine/acylcarnitine transporter), member 20/29 [Candida albicans P87]KGU23497.1 solute carrier family 25 (mitochondrial carnitine/acylcarnitine transporter), member 20/29 [Candida albicans P75063]KHC30821.1 solute carrier family 25 (mitochondrial carnitine/acylcarnitine transporter), member 20/29 [Candida albicans Ca6]CAA2202
MDDVDSALADNVKSFAAGGFGGICAVLTGHPFDLVKVRLQTGLYNSSVQCVKQTIAKDGLTGLYRGVLPPLLGVTPMFAVSFWGYDVGKRLVSTYTGKSIDQFEIKEISTAGFISAIPTTLVAAPFERVKVMMQIQEGNKSKSMAGVVAEMYKTGGLRSIFKGSVATLARDGPGSALYFATYEYLKKELSSPGEDLSLFAIMTAGGFAGVSMWLGVFPIDTIKSTQQSSNVPISILQTTKNIYAKGGVKAFFPGVGPALARSFPANAATFLGVELARKALDSII